MLEPALALPSEMSIGRAHIATAALQLGVALADDELIARIVDADVLERTLRSGAIFAIGPLLAAYARWQAERGDSRIARHLLADVLRGDENVLAFGPALVAAAQFGDRALATLARRAFARAAPGLAAAAPVRAHRAMFEAILAHRRGDAAGAAAAAADATRWFDTLGWRYDIALAQEAAGETDAATAIFGKIGAVRDLRRVERLAPARGALSDREREVAVLVAGGAANRAIARQLAVSEKTVEKHISSIYAKLGFSKRTELTAYIVRGAEQTA